MDHLRFSGLPFEQQCAALETFVRGEPLLMEVLEGVRDMQLPDGLLVAGVIYNMVWNRLTGQEPFAHVKDIDLFYFDDRDLSYEAEDRVIKQVEQRFAQLPLPVEPRNQARVHLWFPEKFNQPFAPLTSSTEMLSRYASKTHAVGVRLDDKDRMEIIAPFGLDPIFSFRVVPNHVLDNRAAHEEKGARAKANWPEVTVEPW